MSHLSAAHVVRHRWWLTLAAAVAITTASVVNVNSAAAADGALPRVSGVVVNDSGQPQERTLIESRSPSYSYTYTANDGRFAYQSGQTSTYGSMTVRTADDVGAPGSVTFAVGGFPGMMNVDLGVVATPDLTQWQIHVVDSQGDPGGGAAVSGAMNLPTRVVSTTYPNEASPVYSVSTDADWNGVATLSLPPRADWKAGVRALVTDSDGTRYVYDLVNGDIDEARKTVTITASGIDFPPVTAYTLPTGVAAQPAISDTYHRPSMKVTWTPATFPDAEIVGYQVQINPGSTIETFANASQVTLSGDAMVIGQSYLVRVRAMTARGNSPWSGWSEPAIAGDAPAIPKQPRITSVRDNIATVEWDKVADPANYPVTGYYVDSNFICPCASLDRETTIAKIPIMPGDTLRFRVRSFNAVGNSAYSVLSQAQQAYGPALRPLRPKVRTSNGDLNVSWEPADYTFASYAAPASGYTVRVNPGAREVQVGPTTFATSIGGLEIGTAYSVTVTATSPYGDTTADAGTTTAGDVPATPAAPTASGGDRQATVTWTAPTNNGYAISGYKVNVQPGNRTISVNAASTQTVVAGLTNGTSYTFTVSAVNAIGTSPPSPASGTVTPAGLPGTVTGLAASATDHQVDLTWDHANPNGSPVTAYTITAEPGGQTLTVGGAQTSASVSGLDNGTSYTLHVAAINSVGSSSSASIAAVPFGRPEAPLIMDARPANAAIEVFWEPRSSNGSDITAYTLTAQPGGHTVTLGGDRRETSITGLRNGTAYTISITAHNVAGDSVAEVWSPVTPQAPPARVTGLRTVASNAAIEVTWDHVRSQGAIVTGYLIDYGTGTAIVSVGRRNLTLTGLKNGTRYAIRVQALSDTGAGPFSAISYAVPGSKPGVVGKPIVKVNGRKVTLTWKAPAMNGSPVSHYLVTSPGLVSRQVSGKTPRLVLNNLKPGRYRFRVVARNSFGAGTASPAVTVVVRR